ncbi:MAG: hypothetical protein KDC71_19380 [Acidobacteria bacterium]|nr:hypothetical protein [Acidobacteriota bacterium]
MSFLRHLMPWLLCLCLISVPSCRKKQNLIDKAFDGKNFTQPLEGPKDELVEPEAEEEEKKEPKVQVLVDNIQDKQGDSTFYPSGKAERPNPPLFQEDPEAPVMNFEEAKLYEIIHMLCKVLKVNYIIDPSVKDQAITIGMVEGQQKMKTSELFDLILKLHSLTMVPEAGFIRILPLESKDVMPGLELLYGNLPNPNLMQEELVIQIIPLKYATPTSISAVVKEFLSSSARIIEEPVNNLMIIIDKANYIKKIMELIPLFDINVLQNKKMVLYQLEFIDAVDTTAQLQDILTAYGFEGSDSERIKLIPMESVNGIMVISPIQEVFKEIEFWIKKLDREAQFEEPQIFIYEVNNTTAEVLAATMGQIYGLKGGNAGGGNFSQNASDRRTTSPNRDPNDQSNRTDQTPQQNQPSGSGSFVDPNTGQLMITDKDNNALIFFTTPREYFKIRKTLRQLDILPRQVFLEVTVLKVELNDSMSLGLNWTLQDGTTENTTPGRSRTLTNEGGLGFTYSYTALTSKISATLSALKNKGFVNVLQQPHIMAIDNKPASINIGQEIPIQTSNINVPGSTGGTTNGSIVSSNNIQYRSTGVDLGFTPHINANGVIRLEIQLGISAPGPANPDANNAPAIDSNSLSTEMIVRDNQTIIMGGIIADSEQWGKTTVPFLGRIPLLRHLFTKRNSSNVKTELVVMITPRVIDSEQKSIEISSEFKEKILKEFENFQVE